MEVGQEIRRLREAKGWSQAKLAGAAGMGVSGVSQIETGARNPSAVTLGKIAQALGGEVGDFYPKAPAPLQLEFEEQVGRNDQGLNKPEEDATERREREALTIYLMEKLAQRGEKLVDSLKSNGSENLDAFLENEMALSTLYEQMASSGELSEELREAERNLGEVTSRVGQLVGQLLHGGGRRPPRTLEEKEQRRVMALSFRKFDEKYVENTRNREVTDEAMEESIREKSTG